MGEIIKLRNVERLRVSGSSRFRLSVPEFSVGEGDFVAVVGESGCGKSTLMDMLALVLRPSAGDEFSMRGKDESMHEILACWAAADQRQLAELRRDRLGYVLQAGGLFPYLSVADNILLPRRLKGLGICRGALHELARHMGLVADERAAGLSGDSGAELDHSVFDKKPRHLSGGQRQRVAIMRALLAEPAVVLADEPTAAVDGLTAQSIMAQFRHTAKTLGIGIVMVTHDRALARTHVDRAYVFERPRLASGSGLVSSNLCESSVSAL